MIRVGFIAGGDKGEWLGGVNYILNLLHAVHALTGRRIEPVVFTPPDAPDAFLAALPPVEVVRTPLLDNGLWLNQARKTARVLLRRDLVMEHFLRSHGVAVLSHSGHLGSRARLPTIHWIPDFQHRRLPDFFELGELAHRDKWFGFSCKFASMIVVSSRDAQRDLTAFAPSALARSRVLHFVSGFGTVRNAPVPLDDLRARYGFAEPYIHLPNQFWAHKNHRLVLDALARFRARGRRILVLATGHTNDRRHPDYFRALMKHAVDIGVEDCFRVLGLVPYEDLAALMRYAVAVVNPSLFEGWSTTVEEAKSMGKSVLLSDIPVHREQAPDRGDYFPPHDPDALAEAMIRTADAYEPATDAAHQAEALSRLPGRMQEFARAYEDIVLETCALMRR